ncbi:phosphatase PAP2 family protein [Defluviitalea raffinosedens]|uniref:Phosphatase PAP2 family protein n=1 Tax=Defluviitalea raffinosedens TaxID=1450156 RepID=A0A7C8LKB1_9FIRM|nr:phosphatase PAP2 family protein [Defluviitalea raffinosedens]KAE9633464.1 phosphatase PAP2 family protein [Defluviitalea raffinosedens]MBM7685934.1 membrane-associated phospholipid phosphatase [Defluviitalea raffinosedens]
MNKVKVFLSNNRHFLILLYYLVILLGYQLLNKITVPKYYMYHPIDRYIPFVPIMVVPYVFWYILITASLVYLGFTNKNDFYRLALFMFGGMTICYIIFIIFPNGQNLRPVITKTNIFTQLITLIYSIDNPTNSAPSIHVIDTMGVFIALRKNEKLGKIKKFQIASAIVTILIIMSTMMIKQHSILDVMYGLLMSLVLYIVIYRIPLHKFSFIRKEAHQRV